MPRPRFSRAAPALREAILEAAAHEFAAHGYAGASLNRILLAAGLSKGAFYYYFDDKADLAATVLEHELAQFDFESLRHEFTNANGFWAEIERFTQYGLQQLNDSQHGRDVMSRLGTAMAKHPELLERCGRAIANQQRIIAAFWQRGQAVGAVRKDLPVSALMSVVQSCKTALAAALLPSDRPATAQELEEFAKVHIDLVRRIVTPRGER